MNDEVYYVKSFEEDFFTKTLKGTEKVNFQSVQDIVKNKIIKPNTRSFGKEMRLSCTILSESYTKTYRPHGIIFQTDDAPDQVFPFDMVLLSSAEKIIVHYYRIKNNLHLYYNNKLIEGFDKFVFKSYEDMIKSIPSPEIAWKKVNEFRVKNGFKQLPRQKYRLVLYNEAVFYRSIRIKPIALYGYNKKTLELSKELEIPHFKSAKVFFEQRQNLKT